MAIHFGYFDSMDGDRLYNAHDISTMFEGLFTDGVFRSVGGGLNVTSNPGTMSVLVAEGRAWFNNLWLRNTSTLILNVLESHLIFDRIDLVILEFDSGILVRENSIKILTGVASSVPIPPLLTKTSTLKQYGLAYIYVPAGSTQIEPYSIVNMIGSLETPYSSISVNLNPPTITKLGAIRRNVGPPNSFVKGVDHEGNLEYGTPTSSVGGIAQRNLTADLTLEYGQSIILVEYLNVGQYELAIKNDATVKII